MEHPLAEMLTRAIGSSHLFYVIDRKVSPEESWFIWSEDRDSAVEAVEAFKAWRRLSGRMA